MAVTAFKNTSKYSTANPLRPKNPYPLCAAGATQPMGSDDFALQLNTESAVNGAPVDGFKDMSAGYVA